MRRALCNSSNPVNQAAERIIFAKGAEDRVTAIIEIQYEGPSERFAWVLPVPASDVEVGLSSKQALETLQQRTNPDYRLNDIFEECNDDDDDSSDDDTADDDEIADDDSADDSAEVDVEVVASGTAGPYDYVQLSVADATFTRSNKLPPTSIRSPAMPRTMTAFST